MKEEVALPPVKIDQFEGPFDLLLELARAHKIDLSHISLIAITDSFFNYVRTVTLPASTQADFLVVASTLLLLKVHRLLPELTEIEEEEIKDLSDRVRIYELYRVQALALREQWGRAMLLPGPERLALNLPAPFPALTQHELAQHFQAVVERMQPPLAPQRHLRKHYRTLRECISLLSTRIQRYRRLIFQNEMRGEPVQVTAVSFLAVLEMARAQQVRLHQEQPFAPLQIDLRS